jgi:hypothetical protein
MAVSSRLAQALRLTTPSTLALSRRHLHASAPSLLAYKNTQDRNSINTDRGEDTQSGRTSDVVSRDDAAFNPSRTSPASERDAAHDNGNPLDVSGANPDVSQPKGAEKETSAQAGAGHEVRKEGGGAQAHGGVKASGQAKSSKAGKTR